MTRLRRVRNDESGMSYVFIGMGLMAFFSATMIAIDVGMLMTSRNQAQNSADAGALAGVTALVMNDWDDRTPSGPAVTHAKLASTSNKVMGKTVSVLDSDVTFPMGPDGVANRVQVDVYRTSERGNPVATMLAKFFGMDTADIGATATAEASPANAMTCVKPFIIPDKWIEKQNPPWDLNDTFEMYDNKKNLLPNADVYVPADQPGYTGYNTKADLGLKLMIRAGTGNDINPTFYFSLAIDGVTGGAEYDWNIMNCNTSYMRWGQIVIQEPGNMMGPTTSGAWNLYNQDPNAYWDTSCRCVKGSKFGKSPRVFPIPLYDPVHYATGKANGRYADLKVANWIGFFLEEIQGNNIWGRITPITGVLKKGYGDAPDGVFPMAIRLVK